MKRAGAPDPLYVKARRVLLDALEALGPLVDALIAHGLAQPTDFLATAEFGSEVAYGKGRTTLRVFRLR
jgi:hypothetical protein